VRLAHVGSHDTASAVCGFGALGQSEMFLNVGTWSLAGAVIDEPIASVEAEAANFTNERTVDGRVRFLRNIPGFYVINRLHEELGGGVTIPYWLAGADLSVRDRVDLLHPSLFNPPSMLDAMSGLVQERPETHEQWAGLALLSLTSTIAGQIPDLERLTGRLIRTIRVGGGGSQSAAFCQSLADTSGLVVSAGPAEATVAGNLALQMLGAGQIESVEEMEQILARSAAVRAYQPQSSVQETNA
jgi:rhamnulokinase